MCFMEENPDLEIPQTFMRTVSYFYHWRHLISGTDWRGSVSLGKSDQILPQHTEIADPGAGVL